MTHILVPINYRINTDVTYDPPPTTRPKLGVNRRTLLPGGGNIWRGGGGGRIRIVSVYCAISQLYILYLL